MKKLHALITALLASLTLVVPAAADTAASAPAPDGTIPGLLPILIIFAVALTAVMVWFFKHRDGY